jgi:hypothetical protein
MLTFSLFVFTMANKPLYCKGFSLIKTLNCNHVVLECNDETLTDCYDQDSEDEYICKQRGSSDAYVCKKK